MNAAHGLPLSEVTDYLSVPVPDLTSPDLSLSLSAIGDDVETGSEQAQSTAKAVSKVSV